MSAAKTFEDLLVWQKAHLFVIEVYKHTDSFPKSEMYGLTSQYRRAAVSIAANISEGFRKKGQADKLRFYNIAQGSLEECRYYIILSRDLGYININQFEFLTELITSTSYLLNNYYNAIKG
jgi:four helix bundle protein